MLKATGVRVRTIKRRIFVSKGNQMVNYWSVKKLELLKEDVNAVIKDFYKYKENW